MSLKVDDFEQALNEIRAKNGWIIEIEIPGPFLVTVRDKETKEILATTGCTSLAGVLVALQIGLAHELWHKPGGANDP